MSGLAGEALGVYTGIGLIAWDVWDHYSLEKNTKPLLRRNVEDYLGALKAKVASEVMGIIDGAATEIRYKQGALAKKPE